ncbi:hypothetical protein ACFLTE_09565 [Bacteroidota bacterium]
MASTSETGHAKNVANFGKLISFCNGYDGAYNPSNTNIQLTVLNRLQTQSQNAINVVNEALPAYNKAVAAREKAFKPLGKLITRLINALKAADTPAEIDEKAVPIVNKLRGKRSKPKLTDEEKQELEENGKEHAEISTSQMSYDNQLDNFDKFVSLLASIPEYNPNEKELKVVTINALIKDLKAKNQAVIDATTPLSNARISRNEMLYKEKEGLVDTALNVKTYVKSVFGAGSAQYKQISGLEFKKYKI